MLLRLKQQHPLQIKFKMPWQKTLILTEVENRNFEKLHYETMECEVNRKNSSMTPDCKPIYLNSNTENICSLVLSQSESNYWNCSHLLSS